MILHWADSTWGNPVNGWTIDVIFLDFLNLDLFGWFFKFAEVLGSKLFMSKEGEKVQSFLVASVFFGVVGFDGGKLMKVADKPIYIPSKKGQYGFMEDITLVLSHIISVYIFERDAKEFGKNS